MASGSVFSFKKRIESIQVLRFCLALLIFLSHFESLSSLNANFAAPVFIFYTVSGFVAMLSTREPSKVDGFLKRRLVRLLPLYWAVTIFTFVAAHLYAPFMSYTPNVVQLLKSLFCIPFARDKMVGGAVTMRPIVGPAHTLEVEVFFSLIFFVCMKLSHKHRGRIITDVCAAFFVIGEVFDMAQFHTNIDIIDFYITHNRLAWLYFLLGVALFELFSRAEAKKTELSSMRGFNAASIVLSAAIFAAIRLFGDRLGTELYYILQAAAGFLLLFFLVMLSQYKFKMPKFLVFCGNVSFSFYLLHYYIVNLAEKALGARSPGARAAIAVVGAFAVSFAAACVSYQIFEKKLPELILNHPKKAKK